MTCVGVYFKCQQYVVKVWESAAPSTSVPKLLKSHSDLLRDDPKLLDGGGAIPETSRKRLAVQFLGVKFRRYLTQNLPGGQLPHVL